MVSQGHGYLREYLSKVLGQHKEIHRAVPFGYNLSALYLERQSMLSFIETDSGLTAPTPFFPFPFEVRFPGFFSFYVCGEF